MSASAREPGPSYNDEPSDGGPKKNAPRLQAPSVMRQKQRDRRSQSKIPRALVSALQALAQKQPKHRSRRGSRNGRGERLLGMSPWRNCATIS